MAVRAIDAIELQQKMCALCNQDYSDEPCEPSDCVFIRAINETPTLTPPAEDNNVPTKAPNEPLTLEELREMDEPTPVWWEKAGYWCLCERGFIIAPNGNIYEFEETDGTFYRRPPEGENDVS